MTKLSPGRLMAGILMLCLAGGLAVAYVPQKIVTRLATTSTEVEGLTFGGRFKLWKAGLNAFSQKPISGYGTAGFKLAITPQLGSLAQVAHNSYISVLVEEGLVGFMLYWLMFLIVFRAVLRLPKVERRFGMILMATLCLAMFPLTWEDRKPVWFILGVLLGLSQAYVLNGRQAGMAPVAQPAGAPVAPPRARPVAPLGARIRRTRPDASA